MTDLHDLKSKFRIMIDKIKKKKMISPETEELFWLFFLAGYRENGGEVPLIPT
ncbi:MAG: hypothetical protein WC758_07505 [Candidatus Woesearchaeota archaeon]|jgi:hypothetical protein